jgi:type II secretory pathway pseudopilin PulG
MTGLHRRTTTQHRRTRGQRQRGLTLIELLLALSGTALIGSAIVSMLFAVSYGTKADKNLRSLVTKQMTLRARIGALIRESSTVLEQGDGYLFLWLHDADESGQPNLDEIALIEFDPAEQTLSVYRAPDSPSSNPAYDAAGDFVSQTVGVKGGADFPAERWASGITAFTLTLDDADAQSARLVSFRLTLAAGEERDTAIGASALRNVGDE